MAPRKKRAPEIQPEVDPLLTVRGVAQTFGLSERKSRELFNRRAFALVRIDGSLYARTSVVNEFLDAHSIPARG